MQATPLVNLLAVLVLISSLENLQPPDSLDPPQTAPGSCRRWRFGRDSLEQWTQMPRRFSRTKSSVGKELRSALSARQIVLSVTTTTVVMLQTDKCSTRYKNSTDNSSSTTE